MRITKHDMKIVPPSRMSSYER